MKNLIICMLSLLFPLSVSAIKLNQRGEKMVSEIKVEYIETDAFYTIKFGYDKMGEINSFVYNCEGAGSVIVKSKRDETGNILREDYYDGILSNKYTFKIDSQKRPTEMVWYEKNERHKKFIKTFTFLYEYGHADADLTITSIEEKLGEPESNDIIRIIDGNAFITNHKKTSFIYGELNNDLNIELSQLFYGYCRVGFVPMNSLGFNFLSLTRWTMLKSNELLTQIISPGNNYIFNYVYEHDNIVKIEVRGFYTNQLKRVVFLKYVD